MSTPTSSSSGSGRHAPDDSSRLESFIPALTWLRTYSKPKLRADLVAGVTIAAIAIPEDMAYAAMAGLSPQVGMYSSLVALLVYAVLGTSNHLTYGATSALSIMVAGTLGAMAFTDSSQYAAAAGFVAISSGVMALLAFAFRLGIVANFVSETVLVGFSAGAALFIGSSQVSKLFGIEGVRGNFLERIWNVIRHLGETNSWTLGVGVASLLALLVLEERFRRLPVPLIVVVLSILLMWRSNLEERGVEVAGKIAQGLPAPIVPRVDRADVPELLGLAFGVFLLSYVEGVGVAKTIAARHKEKIDANQELLANGVANLASGFFRGFSVGGSMSRSAVNESIGAATPATGAFASLLIGIVLLVLTGPFQYLPEATLAAVVLVAVRRLFDVKAFRRLWELDRQEFLAAAATFAGVLTFGMLEGIIIGVGMTFLLLLRRVSAPQTSVLGRKPGSDEFVSLARNPDAE
jgi:high affinity sulfate transporter 1